MVNAFVESANKHYKSPARGPGLSTYTYVKKTLRK